MGEQPGQPVEPAAHAHPGGALAASEAARHVGVAELVQHPQPDRLGLFAGQRGERRRERIRERAQVGELLDPLVGLLVSAVRSAAVAAQAVRRAKNPSTATACRS